MDKALILQNKHWQNQKYKELNKRKILSKIIKKLELKEIEIITGVRRSGKSALLKLIINELIDTGINPNSILLVNIEDPNFLYEPEKDKLLYKLIELSEKITSIKPEYIFFDEIQFLKGWELQVKSLYENGDFKKIFVTGSNSKLLDTSYANLLSGRYTINKIYPYDFREILEFKGIKNMKALISNSATVKRVVDEILLYGSFPEIFKHKDYDLKKELLLSYYDTIIYKDCISYFNIRETENFKRLIDYFIRNIGTLYSYNSLARQIESNENTVKEYIRVLEENFLLNEIKFYSDSFKKQMRENKKSYIIDNSFLTLTYIKNSEDKGRLFENLVFTEFMKRGYELYYFKEINEIDFIVKRKDDTFAVQVSYELNKNNMERELKGLKTLMKKINLEKGMIITYDQENQIDNIEISPFYKYFFN